MASCSMFLNRHSFLSHFSLHCLHAYRQKPPTPQVTRTVQVTSQMPSSLPRRNTSMPHLPFLLSIHNSHRLPMLTRMTPLVPLKAPLSPHLPLLYTSTTEALRSSHSTTSQTNQARQTPYHPHIPPNIHFKHVLTHTFHGPRIPENSGMEYWHR